MFQNEVMKKNSFIAGLTEDIKQYDAEKKSAIEAKKVINAKIEKLLEQREAVEQRIELADQAAAALNTVVQELNIPYLKTEVEVDNEQK